MKWMLVKSVVNFNYNSRRRKKALEINEILYLSEALDQGEINEDKGLLLINIK